MNVIDGKTARLINRDTIASLLMQGSDGVEAELLRPVESIITSGHPALYIVWRSTTTIPKTRLRPGIFDMGDHINIGEDGTIHVVQYEARLIVQSRKRAMGFATIVPGRLEDAENLAHVVFPTVRVK